MKRELVVFMVLMGIVAACLLWLAGANASGPSSWATGPTGLRLAHDIIDHDEPNLRPRRWDRPLTDLTQPAGGLVLALPLLRGLDAEELEALDRWLVNGGHLLLLTSGERPGPVEMALLQTLRLESRTLRDDPPLGWFSWKAWREAEVDLVPVHAGLPAIRSRHGRTHVVAKGSSHTLYTFPDGALAVGTRSRGAGRVTWVNNATAFGNAWITESDNAAAWAGLMAPLAATGDVLFDEFHHGHVAPDVVMPGADSGAFRGIVLQLALLWLLTAWTLSRPFGPVRRVLRPRRGAVARELAALASLHQRAGHASAAGTRLLALARTRRRRRGRSDLSQPDTGLPATFTGGEAALLALARDVGERQRRHQL